MAVETTRGRMDRIDLKADKILAASTKPIRTRRRLFWARQRGTVACAASWQAIRKAPPQTVFARRNGEVQMLMPDGVVVVVADFARRSLGLSRDQASVVFYDSTATVVPALFKIAAEPGIRGQDLLNWLHE
jgi:hypothetical protein